MYRRVYTVSLYLVMQLGDFTLIYLYHSISKYVLSFNLGVYCIHIYLGDAGNPNQAPVAFRALRAINGGEVGTLWVVMKAVRRVQVAAQSATPSDSSRGKGPAKLWKELLIGYLDKNWKMVCMVPPHPKPPHA